VDVETGEILLAGQWTPVEAAAYVTDAWRAAVSSIIETGRRLTEAKLRVGHGNWLAAVDLMPFGRSTAEYLMQTANHPTLSNPDYGSSLPAAWRTLSILAQLPADELTDLIECREVTPELQQVQARSLVAGLRRQDEVKDPVPPLQGTYRCIVIDPPWDVEALKLDGIQPFRPYPTMPLNRIADESWVPVRTHAADNCHLYLWVTQKFLPAGLWLMEQWGFRYQCTMTWRKNSGVTPFSWMYDTEHVLFGRKGNLPLEKLGMRLSFDAKTQGHSIKPQVFYDRVRSASPGPRIDMFARTKREGFDVWGNEVDNASQITEDWGLHGNVAEEASNAEL
jgi:N6-adenosine-specific RNA methylase IME4